MDFIPKGKTITNIVPLREEVKTSFIFTFLRNWDKDDGGTLRRVWKEKPPQESQADLLWAALQQHPLP